MVHYHPLRFAYALTGISAFLYYYLPMVNVDGVIINHYEMLHYFCYGFYMNLHGNYTKMLI